MTYDPADELPEPVSARHAITEDMTPSWVEETLPPDPELDKVLPEDDDDPDAEPSADISTLPRVIIAGSSTWNNHAALEREFFNWWHANGMIPVYVQIGDCPIGAEPMAMQTLREFGLPINVWNADTISPEQRDRAMVASGADIAFIFLDEDSAGASRVRDLCIGAGIPTIVSTRKVYRPHRRYEDQ
jgi:hypothetical protein